MVPSRTFRCFTGGYTSILLLPSADDVTLVSRVVKHRITGTC